MSTDSVPSTSRSSQIESNRPNEVEGIGTDILQFFENLNWNVVEPSEYNACLTQFLPSEKADKIKSHALRLINSQCYPYPQKEYNFKEATKKSIKLLSYYIPGVDGNEIILPSTSALTKQEQFELYLFLCRMKFKNSPLKDCKFFKLQAQMQKEHGEFQIFASKWWINHHCNRCSEIPSSVEEFINKLWKCQLEQCLSLYPPLYMKKTHIALSLNDPNKDHSVMDFIKCIKYKGSLPRLSIPSLKTRCDLITDISKLSQIKQVFSEKEGPQAKTVTPPVTSNVGLASVDHNVDIIIAQDNIDVVLTVSVIKTIVDVYDYQKEWILPITIKNVLKTNGEPNKKVVIIDKKLPSSGMSVYDKNVWHAKIAAKWALVLNSTPSLFDREPIPSYKERKLSSFEEINPVEVAEFGSNACPSQTCSETKLEKQLSPAAETDNENLSNKLENLSILGNGVEETNLADDKSEKVSGNDRKRKNMFDSLPATPSATSPTSDTLPRRTLIAKRYKSINPLQKYTLWGLHKSTHFNMSKQEQRHLKVLVRHRIDGNLTNRSSSHQVVVTSKLEYQPEFGASQMSKSELIRDYVDLYIRKVDLCRVRSVGHTKELMLFEVKNLQEIKDCLQQLHKVETRKVFDPLYAVLTKLIDLPAGHYMLQHTPKMGAFTQLLAENEQHIDFNLISHYENLENLEVKLPAAPIDPYVLTNLHLRDKTPPALFRPKVNTSTAKFLTKPALITKSKKNKKKRKKNKASVDGKTE